MKLKEYSNHWEDGHGNTWNKRDYDRHAAGDAAARLTNCCYCRDCDHCFNCAGCVRCTDCDYCAGCIDCTDCRFCERDRGCKGCGHCTGCESCDDCWLCHECRGCEHYHLKAYRGQSDD